MTVPADQTWFWTPEWQAGEAEAEADIAAGRTTFHRSAESMFAHLRRQDTPAHQRLPQATSISANRSRACPTSPM